ncbi:MAG: hypothetical protein WAT94_00320 [Enterococcus aquimarinus]
MKVFNNWLETLKQIVRDNPKKIAISLIISSVVIGILFFLVSYSRTAIRQNQIEALVYPQILSDKLVPLPYDQESEKIKKTAAISVLFVKPSNPDFQEILRIFEKQDSELNRSIYFYPLIYQTGRMSEKYQLNVEEATFIFFEGGIEKNRFTYQSIDTPEKNIIPELNRLPMWNMKVLETTEESNKE